jgi:hypothetical protein
MKKLTPLSRSNYLIGNELPPSGVTGLKGKHPAKQMEISPVQEQVP